MSFFLQFIVKVKQKDERGGNYKTQIRKYEPVAAKFECSKDQMPNQRLLPYFAMAS